MFDPVEIDQQHLALTHVLPLYSGRRIRLLRLVEFIEPLAAPDGWRFLRAYLPDLLPLLFADLRVADFTGTSPLFLRRIGQIIDVCAEHVPEECGAGEAESARRIIEDALLRAGTYPGTSERVEPRVGSMHRVMIPLVEREHLVREVPPVFGTLGRLSFTVDRAPAGSVDTMFVGHLSVAGESGTGDHSIPLQAARSLAVSYARRRTVPPIRIACSLDRPELLEGESFGLGIAAGAVCGILRLIGHREEFALRPDVALTGCIDAAGNVLPVDEAGLRLKVEACLFSPIRVLVVPAAQVESCTRFLNEHLAGLTKHGGMSDSGLALVGISRLEDVFYNRLLTASRQVPAYRRVWRRLWRMRRVLALALIVLMALVIARLVYGPLDKRPALLEFEGVSLIVRNAHDQVIRRIEVGEGTVVHAHQTLHRYAVLADVDGDGSNEIFGAVAPIGNGDGEFTVECWSSRGDGPLWRTPVAFPAVFPMHPSGTDIRYYVTQLLADDCDNDGVVEVWVSAISSSFAHIIMKLDGRTGRVLGTYLHPGHLNVISATDLDGDGVKEILAAGVNNAFLTACVLALDPRHPDGVGPVQGNYVPAGVSPARHVRYLLVPRTMVGEAFRDRIRANYAYDIWPIHEGAARVRVSMIDAEFLEKSCFSETSAHYYMDLDSTLTPLSMNMGNDYHVMANTLVREGKIPFDPSNALAYHRAYMGSVRYWDGKGWLPKKTD
jgi:hypothetical protein